jgi:prepilin-type N-terminal cleavage/methylation domain-containing protein
MLIKEFNIQRLKGFTLIELIFVILLIAIISITVAPRWSANSLNLEQEARRVLNDIRYTQGLSVTSGQRYRWIKISSTSYQILNESGAPVQLPSGSTQLTLSNNVTLGTLTNLPNNLIAFDSQGIPYTNTLIPGTALSSQASITLTASGENRIVAITPTTGYGVVQ